MKLISKIIITLIILTAFNLPSQASTDTISVTLNGTELSFDQPPIAVNGRTLVPLRAIFESIGATVEWDQATQTVTSTKDDINISLTIDSNILYKNGSPIELDVPAQAINQRTLVPVRAISEAFGAEVEWDENTRTVVINYSPDYSTMIVGNWLINTYYDNDGNAYSLDEFAGLAGLNADDLLVQYTFSEDGTVTVQMNGIGTTNTGTYTVIGNKVYLDLFGGESTMYFNEEGNLIIEGLPSGCFEKVYNAVITGGLRAGKYGLIEVNTEDRLVTAGMGDSYIEINGDGTGNIVLFGNMESLTYTDSVMVIAGKVFGYYYNDEYVTLYDDKSGSMTFRKSD